MSDVKQINVVKIGGNVIDNPDALERFVCDFAKMPAPKILIHGGGKLATRLSEKLEIPTRMIEGRRVTDSETLDIVTMVYAGLVNKQIVAKLTIFAPVDCVKQPSIAILFGYFDKINGGIFVYLYHFH